MFFDNEKEKAREFVAKIKGKKRKRLFDYILKAISIRFHYPSSEYLERVKALERDLRMQTPARMKIARRINLVVFTTDEIEVKSLEKEINRILNNERK